MTLTDIIDHDGGSIYLLDSDLGDQPDTIVSSGDRRLRPGIGALAVGVGQDRANGGLGRVSVDVGDGGFTPEPGDAVFVEECEYLTRQGRQYIGSCYFEECQGELAEPLTPGGAAVVHVRLYELPGPHEPYYASAPGYEARWVPVNVHLLLHIWNEPIGDEELASRAQAATAVRGKPSSIERRQDSVLDERQPVWTPYKVFAHGVVQVNAELILDEQPADSQSWLPPEMQ
ncbi:hypothetical protein ACFWU5_22775 [Nocardia sp. NPDC058640]|uniref:hypothetical protein n=1 Tax=Nocardia sp. NPDC058640 TaxID=3346571 RepID=UPI0036503776